LNIYEVQAPSPGSVQTGSVSQNAVPTRTQLERGDKRGMQGPWLLVISLKGGERAIKGETERKWRWEKSEVKTYSIH